MKCPHCNYEDVIYTDDGEVRGYAGEFYTLDIKAKQEQVGSGQYKHKDILACPSCRTIFLGY